MIYGITPTSLIDYPKEVSFVIYTGGCNFNCPFCHNGEIVYKKNETYDEDFILEMLKERQKLIKAVTITGGEPTIYGDKLIEFIKKVKFLGFKVKLDTNGSNPDFLNKLLAKELLDYIAMDIKNSFAKYKETTNTNVELNKIKESINIIENSSIPYEFRTTINKDMHTIDDILEIKTYFKAKNHLIIQPYRYIEGQVKDVHYREFDDEELNEIKEKCDVIIR